MSAYSFKTCVEACVELDESCPNQECRNWINAENDLNCVRVAVANNGPMTLRQVAEKLGCSFVRVKQIEDEALSKIKSYLKEDNYI